MTMRLKNLLYDFTSSYFFSPGQTTSLRAAFQKNLSEGCGPVVLGLVQPSRVPRPIQATLPSPNSSPPDPAQAAATPDGNRLGRRASYASAPPPERREVAGRVRVSSSQTTAALPPSTPGSLLLVSLQLSAGLRSSLSLVPVSLQQSAGLPPLLFLPSGGRLGFTPGGHLLGCSAAAEG